MIDIFKKGNVLNILFNKHAQLTPSRVQAHPDVLVSFIRDVFPLENIVDEDITIVEDGICLRGAEVAKFTVTYEPVDQIKLSNLCEEMSPPPIPQDILTGQQWIELLRDLLRDGRITEARLHLDNLPPVMKDIVKVGETHVIVPNADNVTEEMLDAPRGVMLYTDVMNDHNAKHVRKMLLADTHYAKYLPEWFLKMEGHMTIRNPKRRLWDTYKVQILLASTSLRDVLWNPQCNNPEGISKRLKPSKAAFYAKLDKYQNRADTGR